MRCTFVYVNGIALFKHKLSSLSLALAIMLVPIQTVTQRHHREDAILTLKHCHGFHFLKTQPMYLGFEPIMNLLIVIRDSQLLYLFSLKSSQQCARVKVCMLLCIFRVAWLVQNKSCHEITVNKLLTCPGFILYVKSNHSGETCQMSPDRSKLYILKVSQDIISVALKVLSVILDVKVFASL